MSKRILVIEDQEDLRGVLRDLLTGSGYAVLEAADGEAGVASAKTEHPDLILMDIAMPEITGVEAMHAILKQRPGMPFLYMTGYLGPTKLDPSEQRVLKKPFTIADLAEKVEELLFPGDGASSGNVIPITVRSTS